MLRACNIDFMGNWDKHLPLVYFDYNNNFHSSVSMYSYEALYGKRCRSPIRFFEVVDLSLLGPDLSCKTLEKIRIIRNLLQGAYCREKSYADHKRMYLES